MGDFEGLKRAWAVTVGKRTVMETATSTSFFTVGLSHDPPFVDPSTLNAALAISGRATRPSL